MAILGIVAVYKILKVSVFHRILLQGKVHICPQVIDPNFLGLHIGARGTLIEKDDIRLDAGLVEDTGRQAQDRMQVGGFEQLLTHCFTGAALKENIIGDDDSRFSVRLQQRVDMLNEVELFVGAGRPEVLTVIYQLVLFLLALVVGEGDRRFLAEGRIRQHIVNARTGIGQQRVAERDRHIAVDIADVVQIQIHQRGLVGGGDDLVAEEGLALQKLLCLTVEGVMRGIGDILMRRSRDPLRFSSVRDGHSAPSRGSADGA